MRPEKDDFGPALAVTIAGVIAVAILIFWGSGMVAFGPPY